MEKKAFSFGHRTDLSDHIGYAKPSAKRDWSAAPKNEIETNPSPVTPELRLVVAVLVRAIRDIADDIIVQDLYKAKNYQRCASEAEQWVNSESIEPWSFLWCCASLGFDEQISKAIRQAIPSISKRDLDYLT